MTKKVRLFICTFSIATMLCFVPVAINTIGCASAGKNAYVTSGITHVTAVTALKGWNEYLGVTYTNIATQASVDPVKAEKRRVALLEQEKQVKDAHVKYQAAQLAVLVSAKEFSRLPPNNPNTPAAEDRLVAAIAAASVTLTALLDLLQQFGIKL